MAALSQRIPIKLQAGQTPGARVWLQVADLLVSVVQNVANPSNATNACKLQNAWPLREAREGKNQVIDALR